MSRTTDQGQGQETTVRRDTLTENKDEAGEKFEDALDRQNPAGNTAAAAEDTDEDDDEDLFQECSGENGAEEAPELAEDDTASKKDQLLQERLKAEESLSEEQKQERRRQAGDLKTTGNDLYLKSELAGAVEAYSKALDLCPLCFKEDRAVFFANRAAAKLKSGDKEDAVNDCNEAIELNPTYVKAILRRAQIHEDIDKPHEAMKDFEKVLQLDPKHIESLVAVQRLPEKIKEKDEKLKAEMLDNLKKLGNMVLKPFGLSTENFQMVQDPNSGGYSINFKR